MRSQAHKKHSKNFHDIFQSPPYASNEETVTDLEYYLQLNPTMCTPYFFNLSLQNNPRVTFVRYMLEHNPELAKPSKSGNFPLDTALKYNTSLEVVKAIILAYPEALLIGSGNCLPLTYAKIWRKEDKNLIDLLEQQFILLTKQEAKKSFEEIKLRIPNDVNMSEFKTGRLLKQGCNEMHQTICAETFLGGSIFSVDEAQEQREYNDTFTSSEQEIRQTNECEKKILRYQLRTILEDIAQISQDQYQHKVRTNDEKFISMSFDFVTKGEKFINVVGLLVNDHSCQQEKLWIKNMCSMLKNMLESYERCITQYFSKNLERQLEKLLVQLEDERDEKSCSCTFSQMKKEDTKFSKKKEIKSVNLAKSLDSLSYSRSFEETKYEEREGLHEPMLLGHDFLMHDEDLHGLQLLIQPLNSSETFEDRFCDRDVKSSKDMNSTQKKWNGCMIFCWKPFQMFQTNEVVQNRKRKHTRKRRLSRKQRDSRKMGDLKRAGFVRLENEDEMANVL